MSKTFTVLTVSKRTGWELGWLESISRQSYKPSRHVIVTEQKLNKEMYSMEKDIRGYGNINFIKIIEAPKTKNPSNLNASLNAGLKLITTDYVIFYQDFIDLAPDCFEKLIALAAPDTFVTTCTPNYDGSNDLRYLGWDEPRTCLPEEWETNVALAPMQFLRDLGGFEEELDKGWSWDNVNVALRAEMMGAKFVIDESNRPRLLPHEQTSKLTMELNGERNAQIIQETRTGKRPLKLDYLK